MLLSPLFSSSHPASSSSSRSTIHHPDHQHHQHHLRLNNHRLHQTPLQLPAPTGRHVSLSMQGPVQAQSRQHQETDDGVLQEGVFLS
jgi:hypothetical protein